MFCDSEGFATYKGVVLPWDYFSLADMGRLGLKNGVISRMTGLETNSRNCWLCGAELKLRQQRYCSGHGALYHELFDWNYARACAINRVRCCENCGSDADLQVHHITPLEGRERYMSRYNLPWNLMVLCHDCHVEIHAVMNGDQRKDSYQLNLL